MVLEVETSAVDRDEIVDLALERVAEEVARAAEIPLSFLADVPDEVDRPERLHVRLLERAKNGKHDRQTATVVADAGPRERRTVALHLDVGALGKDRVEVTFDEYRWSRADPAPLGDDIADAVDAEVGHA